MQGSVADDALAARYRWGQRAYKGAVYRTKEKPMIRKSTAVWKGDGLHGNRTYQ
jgi:hypothetical protein